MKQDKKTTEEARKNKKQSKLDGWIMSDPVTVNKKVENDEKPRKKVLKQSSIKNWLSGKVNTNKN